MISEMDEARLMGLMHPKVEAVLKATRQLELACAPCDGLDIKVARVQSKLARLAYMDYLKDRENQEG